MTGWSVAWWCFVACVAGELSQQPTCPQAWHTRRWTQSWRPAARQSSQPSDDGVTAPIVGARTAEQLKASLLVEEVELPAEIVAALDDVSAPSPEGDAR